ncbi:MAG: hypothetical protein ABI216_12460 [Devosia sp.]
MKSARESHQGKHPNIGVFFNRCVGGVIKLIDMAWHGDMPDMN